jgi:two-component system, sensor histidine kinase LadS
MLDIDNFKQINDTYGHLFGDECLKKLAKVLETQTESIEQFAARYGGEEFSIILHNFNSIEAEQFANQCLKVVQDENISIENKLNLTVSIGVATLNPGDEGKKKLISMADEALYKAKHNGKDRVVVYENKKPHHE